jgi:hypothetical protein
MLGMHMAMNMAMNIVKMTLAKSETKRSIMPYWQHRRAPEIPLGPAQMPWQKRIHVR